MLHKQEKGIQRGMFSYKGQKNTNLKMGQNRVYLLIIIIMYLTFNIKIIFSAYFFSISARYLLHLLQVDVIVLKYN